MTPQQLWKKLMKQLSSISGSKAQGRLKNLLILLGLGIALMLLSHLYSGGNHAKSGSQSSKAYSVAKVTTNNHNQSQPASVIKSSQQAPQSLNDYATYYQDELAKMLNNMAGISNASVMVTLSTGPEKVYQQDAKTSNQRTQQKDSNGGTQTTSNQTNDQTTVMVNKNGQSSPLLITQKGPTFRAILVVANGVTSPAAKERIVSAVSTVLDVPSYKVSVQERK